MGVPVDDVFLFVFGVDDCLHRGHGFGDILSHFGVTSRKSCVSCMLDGLRDSRAGRGSHEGDPIIFWLMVTQVFLVFDHYFGEMSVRQCSGQYLLIEIRRHLRLVVQLRFRYAQEGRDIARCVACVRVVFWR